MEEGTRVPAPERDDATHDPAVQIFLALKDRDWELILRVLEGAPSRPPERLAAASRAALLAMPHRMRDDPRWLRNAALLTQRNTRGPLHVLGKEPMLTLTESAIRLAHSGDLTGAAEAIERATALLDGGTTQLAHMAELPRIMLAWADITAAMAHMSRAFRLYVRAYATARERGDRGTAVAAASGAASVQSMLGLTASCDDWIAEVTHLRDAEAVDIVEPMVLRLARIARAIDRLDTAEAADLLDGPRTGDLSTLDVALRVALFDCVAARRSPDTALADLDAAVLVAPLHVRSTPIRSAGVRVMRARLLLLAGRVHAAQDLLGSSSEDEAGALSAEISALRAAASLACGDIDGAMQQAYLATNDGAQLRAVVIGSAVIAAALVERRHVDFPAACARAVSLADEHDLTASLTVLSRRHLDVVLSFASPGSRSAGRLREGLAHGALCLPPRVPPLTVTLSTHELAVLRRLSEGMSMGRTAMVLRISPNTVKTHARHIYRKLGVSSRQEMRDAATEHGLL